MSNRSMLSSRPLVVGLWLRIMCSSVESSQNMFFHNPIDKPKPLPRPLKSNHNIKISTALICRGAASVITNPSHGVYIGVSMTSRRLDSHGMVEENRSETALPGARAIVPEMTAECGEANSSGTWALCKEGMH
ncbi:hypothetical protein YC2023_016109 [Brassica napus]